MFDLLTDPQTHRDAHPLIFDLILEPSPPGETRLVFVDRVPLLGVPIQMKTHVVMHADPEALTVTFRARAILGVRVRTTHTVIPTPGGCRVMEQLTLEAPRWLHGKTVREATLAHQAVLDWIKRVAEA